MLWMERVPFGTLFFYFREVSMHETYTQLALFTINQTRLWYKGKIQLVVYTIDWQGNFNVLSVVHE